jgi:hypothetical protein
MITAVEKIQNGDLRYDDVYTLEEADRAVGSGPLQFKQAGTKYTIDQLLTYLGQNSDNTAWVMFNRRFGKAAIRETMERIGLVSSNYDELTTTAKDVARMWDYIYQGGVNSANRNKVWGYLTNSIYEDRLPAGLTGTGAKIIGHKVGTDMDVWSDAGIIESKRGDFVLVIMNKGVIRSEAAGVVPEIAKMVWTFENGSGVL